VCLMMPGRVISIDDESCAVQTGDRVDRVSMLMTPEVEAGDWVLINAGTVVRRLDPDQAAEMSKAFGEVFGRGG
jgi:hydrogenase expression/formation protein HypC